MNRLTFARVNGIKTGYWSAAKKDELIQRLGPLEEYGGRMLKEICVEICRHTKNTKPKTPSELFEQSMFCGACPVKELANMLGGIENQDQTSERMITKLNQHLEEEHHDD